MSFQNQISAVSPTYPLSFAEAFSKVLMCMSMIEMNDHYERYCGLLAAFYPRIKFK